MGEMLPDRATYFAQVWYMSTISPANTSVMETRLLAWMCTSTGALDIELIAHPATNRFNNNAYQQVN
ncbi:MAG: hypothetical protein R3C44_05865 [Chloroflexota bacterium]